MNAPATTLLPGMTREDLETPPAVVRGLLWLLVASSFFVMREPAPCDVLFPPLALAVLLFCRPPVTGYGLIGTTGAAVWAASNVISASFAWLPLAATMRYMAITFYLLASTFVVAALIARYGAKIVEPTLRAFLLAAAIASAIGILARFHAIPNPEVFFRDASGLRIKSTFKDPNVFAPFVAAASVVALDDLVVGRRGLVRSILLQGLYLLALLFAFSRGAFLNFGVALAVYAGARILWMEDVQARARLLRVGVAAAVILVPVLVFALAASGLGEYFSSRLSFQGYDSERFAAQRESLAVAEENLLGIGPGNWTQGRFETDTHNSYLRVLAENGVLGLLGFLLFTLGSTLRAFAGLRLPDPFGSWCAVALAVLAGTLVESLVIDTIHWRHFFLFLGIPVGIWMYLREAR